MCDAALNNGITPILCTIPPYKKGDESTQIDYGKRAISLMNRNTGTFCDLNTDVVKRADIYSALESSTWQGYMNPDFAADLLHINTRGHAKLAAVLFKVLTGADIEFFLQDRYMVSS